MRTGSEDWLVRPVNSQIIADHFATKVEVRKSQPGIPWAALMVAETGGFIIVNIVVLCSMFGKPNYR